MLALTVLLLLLSSGLVSAQAPEPEPEPTAQPATAPLAEPADAVTETAASEDSSAMHFETAGCSEELYCTRGIRHRGGPARTAAARAQRGLPARTAAARPAMPYATGTIQ